MASFQSPLVLPAQTRYGESAPIVRRNLSVFSRRGDEAGSSCGQPYPLLSAARPSPHTRLDPPKISCTSSNRHQGGTVLNRVPLQLNSSSSPFTASPTLNESTPLHHSTHPVHPPLRERQIRLMRSASRLPRTRSQQAKHNNARIGIWVDGVAVWDELTDAHLSIIAEESTINSARSSFHGALLRHGDISQPDIAGVAALTLPQLDRSESFAAAMVPMSTTIQPDGSVNDAGDISSVSCSSAASSDSGHDDVSSLHHHTGSISSVDSLSGLPSGSSKEHLKTRHMEHVKPLNLNKGLPPTPAFYESGVEQPLRLRRAAPPPPKHHIITQALGNAPNVPTIRPLAPKVCNQSVQTPTLGDAEVDLVTLLSGPLPSLTRKSSVQSVLAPQRRSPTLPRRSRKREWKAGTNAQRISLRPSAVPERRHSTATGSRESSPASISAVELPADNVRRSRSLANGLMSASSEYSVASFNNISDDSQIPNPQILVNNQTILEHEELFDANPEVDAYLSLPSSDEAVQSEAVLVSILASLHSVRDLLSMAVINKGMYRVYQEYELEIITCVLRRESPPAAEYRDWRCPAPKDIGESTDASSSFTDMTAENFRYSYARDLATLNSLKALMASTCESILRHDTFLALSSSSYAAVPRTNNALWRIWCFCEIFGSNKDREDDLVGQLDWLKGGQLAKGGDDCEATVNQDADFEVNSVMLNPPEFFAIGNDTGLTASELFDMLELWTCTAALLQGYHGFVQEARTYGVFDGMDVASDDEHAQAAMIQEWTSYIMTLGLDVVLELASVAHNPSEGFARAQRNGWTRWSQPEYSSSRESFLKDPVTRLYREQVRTKRASADDVASSCSGTSSRTTSTQRTSHLAMEIRLSRHESQPSQQMLRLPSTGRDASACRLSRSSSVHTAFSFVTNASRQHYRRDTIHDAPSPRASSVPPSAPHTPVVVPVVVAPRVRPQPPRIDTTFSGTVRPNRYSRVVLEHYGHGEADNTSSLAIRRLVDMGFLPSEAREALRVTDPGNGLRLDRAVEYLLRLRASQ